MSDPRRIRDEQLAAALSAIDVEWPTTPSLAPAVAATIREMDRAPQSLRPRLSLPSRRRTVLILVAALIVLAVAAFATKLVIDLGAVTIQTAPGTPPASLPVFSPGVFGDPVADTAAASARAGFPVALPRSLGTPTRVWVWRMRPYQGEPEADQVVLVWDPGTDLPRIHDLPWGAVLMELTGKPDLVAKTLYSETSTIQPIVFRGGRAYWIQGPHTVTIQNPQANGTIERRVEGNVLIWEQGGRVMRLETTLDLDHALDLAFSTH